MSNPNMQARKAAGSSDRRRSSAADSQPRRADDQPQAQHSTYEEYDFDDEHVGRLSQYTKRHRSSTSASHHPRDYEQFQTPPPRPSSQSEQHGPKASSREDWFMIDRAEPVPCSATSTTSTTGTTGTSTSAPPPSYDFPGTWGAALHETTSALTQVGAASMSYATALSRSGIGKAGWSIGSALASSANKGAISLAGWGIEQSGADTTGLPEPVKKWLGQKEKMDEARWRARQSEERRRERKGARGGSEPLTFGDERGAFVLETHELDSTGRLVETTKLNELEIEVGMGKVGEDEEEGDEEGEEEREEEREEDDGLLRVFQFDE